MNEKTSKGLQQGEEARTCLDEQTGVNAPGTPTTTTFFSTICNEG
jgi:hypothetical protein